MSDNKKIIIGVTGGILLLVIAAVAIFLTLNRSVGSASVETVADTSKTPVEITLTADGPSPSAFSVPVGTPITWINLDDKPHTITFHPANKADASPTLEKDQSYTAIFSFSASYDYSIDKDGPVLGTIIVN